MADDEIEQTEEERIAAESEAKGQREQEIAERLKSIEANVSGNTEVAKLMADPDVRALLEAKQAGRKVKLVADDVAPPEEDEPDFNNMSNTDLVKHLGKVVVRAASEAAEKRMAGMEGQLTEVMRYIQTSETTGVQKQIETMKAKFPDFDNLRKTMAEINRATPGHSVEELYVLAKVREGGLEGLQSGLGSERPTGSTARPPRKQQRKVPLPTGRRGFAALLDEALSKAGGGLGEADEGEELDEE